MTVIADLSIPSEGFVLGETMQAVSAESIEIEQLVPLDGVTLPYFWLEKVDADAAEAALEEEPAVKAVTQIDELDGRVLFRIDWTEDVDSFLENLVDYEAAVLEAVGTHKEWQFQLRFPSYEELSTFYRACIEDGLAMDLQRVHNPIEATSRSRYGLTADQRETIMRAYEDGYYSIPRKTSIQKLGEELDISDSAVSQRLRRGEGSLIAATLLTAADTSISGHRE